MKGKIKKMIEKFNYWDAIEELERLRAEKKADGEELLELAHLYRGVGDMEKALRIYEEAKEMGVNEAIKFIETTKIILEQNK